MSCQQRICIDLDDNRRGRQRRSARQKVGTVVYAKGKHDVAAFENLWVAYSLVTWQLAREQRVLVGEIDACGVRLHENRTAEYFCQANCRASRVVLPDFIADQQNRFSRSNQELCRALDETGVGGAQRTDARSAERRVG